MMMTPWTIPSFHRIVVDWVIFFQNKLHLTRDLVDDASILARIAVPAPVSDVAPKLPTKCDAKEKTHVEKLKIQYNLTNKSFVSECANT